jgi:hypothetical protein
MMGGITLLCFLSEPERAGIYFDGLNRGIRLLLKERAIAFLEVPLSGDTNMDYSRVAAVAAPGCTWLLSDAAAPVVPLLGELPGRKAGHVHGPAALPPGHLEVLDILLADSLLLLPGRQVSPVAFPFAPPPPGRKYARRADLLVFDQDFCADNLNVVEVFLFEELKETGFKVIHLSSAGSFREGCRDRETRALVAEAQRRGLRFFLHAVRREYTDVLSGASLAVSTALYGAPRLRSLEAAALGVRTLAPACGSFPRYLPPDQLYAPFNLNDIVNCARRLAAAGPSDLPFLSEAEADAYLALLGVA